jgi:hypothetical protein
MQVRSTAGMIRPPENPVTLSAIEYETFRLEAYCFNQLRYHLLKEETNIQICNTGTRSFPFIRHYKRKVTQAITLQICMMHNLNIGRSCEYLVCNFFVILPCPATSSIVCHSSLYNTS